MQPKRYRALHITPGLVDYTEGNQRETVLIRKAALDKMNPSFLGKPVFNFIHKNIDPQKAFDFTEEEKEELASGVVSNVGYDVETGYFFVDMMIWDEEAQKNIDEKGFGVSNAYVPEVEAGGVYNNVPYDEEVIGGEYYHMAIVENPRYGDVKIFQNSNEAKIMKFKLFGKKEEKPKTNAADPPKEEEKKPDDKEMAINADSVLVDEQGNEYPLSELISAYKDGQDKKEEEKPTINMEDTIDVDGKEVSVKDLYDNYCAKKNAEPPTDTPLEDVVKQNSADGGKEKPNENFKKLKINAARGAEPEKIVINTEKKRLERGKQLYGSQPVQAKAQGGK